MPVALWGNGQDAQALSIGRTARASYLVADDPVPYPRARWRPRCYQRLSVVGPTGWMPRTTLDSSLLAQTIRSANRLWAVDECVFPIGASATDNLESALWLVGTNDQPPSVDGVNTIAREWSEVVLAVAGDVGSADADRIFAAVRGRNDALRSIGRPPAIAVAWEAYHTVSVWGTDRSRPFTARYDDLRAIDRFMLDRCAHHGLQSVSWMLGTMADRPDLAEANNAPHYAACSYDPDGVKPVADEEAFADALVAGWPVVGAWAPYATAASAAEMADAIDRAIRRVWPSGPRDTA